VKHTPGSSWSMFAKNGNDVTTLALTVARAQTGKKTVLVQPQGYHGAGPVWTKERQNICLGPAMCGSWLRAFSFVFAKRQN
jgi:glutamate-1-semialdehyde aminotransferase